MAAPAELAEIQTIEQQINELVFELPEVLVVSEMLHDQETRQKAARFIGAAITGTTLEVVPVKSPIESLCEAIQLAAEGDKAAEALVRTNAKTDVIERTIKTGHVMDPVPLVITDEGSFI